MCLTIIDKWLLPAFNQKLLQTLSKRREPNWFKDFLNEWSNLLSHDLISKETYTDISKWVCSCEHFKISCFYLCQHLISKSQQAPKFRSQIRIQDIYPFLVFQNGTEDVVVPNIPAESFILTSNIPTESNLPAESFIPDTNIPTESNETCDKEGSETYNKIINLIQFLGKEANQHQFNIQQLNVIEKNLKNAFKYKEDIEVFTKAKQIPRTWKDLNENTMYY